MRVAFSFASTLMATNQSRIRKQVRRSRRALSLSQQKVASMNLMKQLSKHPLFLSSQRIAFYLSNDGEIDLNLSLKVALTKRKQCYLPVLYRGGENRLLFARVTETTRFKANKYGIPEPDIAAEGWLFTSQLDLVLTPLVAFDCQGNRIGMGGGYYDRSLRQLTLKRNWRRPKVLGIAHQFQQVDSIKRNFWDVPLQGVITDQQIFTFK